MTFSVVTAVGWAHGILLSLLWKKEYYSPPLEKGGEGGLEIANENKISPDPSLPKRGSQWRPPVFAPHYSA
jgi:hypothetical protein